VDETDRENQIGLYGGPSFQERLIGAGIAVAILLFARAELAIVSFLMMAIGAAILCRATFAVYERWTISRNQVLIKKTRPLARPQIRVIRSDEVSEIQVHSDRARAERFRIVVKLASGEQLTSPPIADITRVHQASRRIAELLGVPRDKAPDNPLDAANAEIRIGSPVRKAVGTDTRIITSIIAGLCTIPYAYKFWNGLPLATAEIIFLPIGIVVAFLLFRYAYSLAGTFWIVRHGELRIERLSRDGEPVADTITGLDIETILIEPPDEGEYFVTVELRSGKKMRSPEIGSKPETQAVSDEIVRRLGIAPERVRR
jgi:membrane protein implicated in regulation of membrane protease activity